MEQHVLLYRDGSQQRVAIYMPSATLAHGNWRTLDEGSTATLEFSNGVWDQTGTTGPQTDRRLFDTGNQPLLVLQGFVAGANEGIVTFNITDTNGSFGTEDARWRRLEA
jgi:hypothetical protein